MRLSEAIRLGAMVTGKANGEFWTNDGNACAQGAALLAIGQLVKDNPWPNHKAMEKAWPWLNRVVAACPAGCDRHENVRSLIPHLNNNHEHLGNHDWDRERIADWVATVEPVEIPASVEEVRAEARP